MDQSSPNTHARRTTPVGVHPLSGHRYAMPCRAVDETAVKTNLTRLRGRSLKGQRLYGTAPFGKWGTQTFIAGLTQNELIAPWVIAGAMDVLLP